ncbi:MAG: proliferating cell nuclear antigen (pcna) [Candidatus Bathyarchaeia archaeon]
MKMADARQWKNLITAISTLIDEASFNFDEKGVKLRAMDPSHVAMVDFEWPSTIFEEYVCDVSTKLCINIGEMLKLLRRVSVDESLELGFDSKSARLSMVLKSRYTRTFGMATLEPSTEDIPTPKIVFNASARLTTELLRNALDDAHAVSDHITFDISSERLLMRATGDVGNVIITVEKGTEELLSLEVSEPSRATFSLNYLSEMVKASTSLSEVVSIDLSTDMPIRLNFELPQGGKLQYYLAPRIESQS